ncbi:hypothetical protein SAMD00079811_55230 [Scytonema sp. HK-05]|nr:hypothetical protein SAMD00079811_55230 [Scytonema sp. HK-05]
MKNYIVQSHWFNTKALGKLYISVLKYIKAYEIIRIQYE